MGGLFRRDAPPTGAACRVKKTGYPYPHEPEDLQMLPHLPKGFEYGLAFRFAPLGKNPPCGGPGAPAAQAPARLNVAAGILDSSYCRSCCTFCALAHPPAIVFGPADRNAAACPKKTDMETVATCVRANLCLTSRKRRQQPWRWQNTPGIVRTKAASPGSISNNTC